MKRIALFATLFLLAAAVLAAEEPGLAVLEDLGRLNGQALACRQMPAAAQAKQLMIKHAPKTRRYGEVFEAATNTAFLKQGKEGDSCPESAAFSSQLAELAKRLQANLPVTP